MTDSQILGELFHAVWAAFPDNPEARRRIYQALDREGITEARTRAARISAQQGGRA